MDANENQVSENAINSSITPGITQAKNNSSRLPRILIILGVLETGYFLSKLIIYVVSIPQMVKLFRDANVEIPSNPYMGIYLVIGLIFLTIGQIAYGFSLNSIQRTHGVIPIKHRTKIRLHLSGDVVSHLQV